MKVSQFLGSLGLSAMIWLATPGTPGAQEMLVMELYNRCALNPVIDGCADAYKHAQHDDSPQAVAVRDAYQHYARYLKGAKILLTDSDFVYLRENQIAIPFELNAQDKAGLHNVINDPSLVSDPLSRKAEVNNFISRATEAELYCYFNVCTLQPSPAGS